MYETKLANSIQMDYRQAADNHRVAKAVAPKTRISIPVKAIAITALVAVSTLIIALQPTITYASSGAGGHVGG